MRFFLCFFMAFTALRCGVEAGNAGSGKGLVGNVKILFAQEQNTGSESLSVDLGSLALLGSDDQEAATLTPSISTVDLYGSEATDNTVIAESTSVPAGTYAKITIRLNGDKPVRYRDAGGNEREVGLADSNPSFTITQAISITANETTTIVINLDPYRSLQPPDANNRFIFKPRGDAAPRDQDVNYKGTTAVPNALWVCAYAYVNHEPPRDPPPPRLLDGLPPPGGLPPPLGTPVEGRPRFGTKPELVKDTVDTCDNAFAKAPVVGGTFEFRHLRPGPYALRVFDSTGLFTDVDADLILGRREP